MLIHYRLLKYSIHTLNMRQPLVVLAIGVGLGSKTEINIVVQSNTLLLLLLILDTLQLIAEGLKPTTGID